MTDNPFAIDYREPEPSALSFLVGGEEGFEDVGHVLSLDPEAEVGHLEAHVPVTAGG